MTEFELQKHEYIPLNNLLKLLSFVQSGGEANQCIEAGEVIVNNLVEMQKRKKLREGDQIVFRENTVVIIE